MTTLRPYQVRAIEATREAYRKGARGVCLVLPTGAGKTVILAEVARAHLSRGGKVVVYVHRDELMDQTWSKLRAVGLTERDGVTVESVQTVCRRTPGAASLVILDECHHFGQGADVWSSIPRAHQNAHRLGLTATPSRGDGTALVGFDSLVSPVSVKELTELGHLVPCEVIAPRRGGELADPVSALDEYAPGRPAVVYCGTVNHAQSCAQRLGGLCIEGAMPADERADALARFQRGEVNVLTNVYVLTEGWDAPRAEVCVVGRGAGATCTWLQMLGRVLRPFAGKRRALVIDCKGSVYAHGLPTDPREWSLEGKACRAEKNEPLRQCPQCGGVFRYAPKCNRCAYVFPPPPPPKVKKLDMVPVDTTTPPNVKRGHWMVLSQEAKRRGYKPGWAMYRFKAKWGHWPLREWMAA